LCAVAKVGRVEGQRSHRGRGVERGDFLGK